MERKHIAYFDYVRIIAALFVIFMHASSYYFRDIERANWSSYLLPIALSFSAVLMFFMMSGYLVISDPRSSDISLLKKRIPKLIVPLIAWTVLTAVYNAGINQDLTVSGIVTRAVSGLHTPIATPFWYMYTLAALYLISPLLSAGILALDEKGQRYILILSLIPTVFVALKCVSPDWLDPYLEINLVEKLTFLSGHLSTFVLGYFLCRSERRVPVWLLLLAEAAVLAIITYGTWYETIRTGQLFSGFVNQSAGLEVLQACLLIQLFRQLANRSALPRLRPLVGELTALSLGIYMMHDMLLSIMRRMGFDFGRLAYAMAGTVICFLICWMAPKIAATVPGLCYGLTGLSFQTACRSGNWIAGLNRLREKRNLRQ